MHPLTHKKTYFDSLAGLNKDMESVQSQSDRQPSSLSGKQRASDDDSNILHKISDRNPIEEDSNDDNDYYKSSGENHDIENGKQKLGKRSPD